MLTRSRATRSGFAGGEVSELLLSATMRPPGLLISRGHRLRLEDLLKSPPRYAASAREEGFSESRSASPSPSMDIAMSCSASKRAMGMSSRCSLICAPF
jgi:hypothetical protein